MGQRRGLWSSRLLSAGVPATASVVPLPWPSLGRLLATAGIEISVDGEWLACTRYADGVTAFLLDLDPLPAFLAAMEVFGAVDDQRLSTTKD